MKYPTARPCHHCDFSSGRRGMDSCGKCEGTGSLFLIYKDRTIEGFPNTREGWVKACKLLGLDPDGDEG